jgi:hypothetical protein
VQHLSNGDVSLAEKKLTKATEGPERSHFSKTRKWIIRKLVPDPEASKIKSVIAACIAVLFCDLYAC